MVPTLNEQVVGLDVVRSSFPAKKWKSMQRPAKTDAEQGIPDATRPNSTAPSPPDPPPIDPSPSQHTSGASSSHSGGRPPPPRQALDADPASPFFLKQFSESESEAESVEPEVAVASAAPAKPTVYAMPTGPNISPRLVRYAIYYGLRFLPFVLIWFFIVAGGNSSDQDVRVASILFGLGGAFVWFKFGSWVAEPFGQFAMAALYNSIRCPGCGEVQPVITRWSCGCGYNDHREQNFFLFKCPSCGSRLGHFNCRMCNATVLC